MISLRLKQHQNLIACQKEWYIYDKYHLTLFQTNSHFSELNFCTCLTFVCVFRSVFKNIFNTKSGASIFILLMMNDTPGIDFCGSVERWIGLKNWSQNVTFLSVCSWMFMDESCQKNKNKNKKFHLLILWWCLICFRLTFEFSCRRRHLCTNDLRIWWEFVRWLKWCGNDWQETLLSKCVLTFIETCCINLMFSESRKWRGCVSKFE